MKLIGFNFSKINIERFSEKVENLKINTNINISDIEELKSDFLSMKEALLKIKFTYNINYDPDFAKIEFMGDIILAVEPKEMKDVLKQWKNKKIAEDFKITVFNIVLRKSNLKALQLEDEMNLPLHLPLPSLKQEEKEE